MPEDPGREPEPGRSSAAKDLRWRKKIIVCCDGTGQKNSAPISNVCRIHDCIKDQDQDGIQQKKKYWPGIGTGRMKIPGLLKQAIGAGISRDIREAYSFICEEYESDRSMICLIGYSRGAYTVRCVAQFIQDAGLLRRESIQHLPALFSLWEKKGQKVRDEPLVMENSQHGVRVRVCAVWDTVSSLGLPMIAPIPQPAPTRMSFVNSRLSQNIDQAFQALALHEHRRHFLPIVWKFDETPPNPDFLKQCWFSGYHSDIGGGRKEEFLAHIALIWMMASLANLLDFDLKELWKAKAAIPSWKINEKVKEYQSEKVERYWIKDSFSGVFRIGGSKSRKPRCHFWDPLFVESRPIADNSRERIHLTVGGMIENKAIRPCKALKDAKRRPQTGEQQVWHLEWDKDGDKSPYDVPEDVMDIRERDWLGKWAREELRRLQKKSQAGDKSPKTEIAVLLHILRAFSDGE